MKSKVLYVLAVLMGLLSPFLPEMQPYPLPLCMLYFLGGGILGYLSPKVSWRWGIWMVAPIGSLLILSILFAGQLDVFFKKDLPVLLLTLFSACLGSYITSRMKNKNQQEETAVK